MMQHFKCELEDSADEDGGIPFTNVVWEEEPGTEIPGERGSSVSRTVQSGDVRVRMVEMGAGYRGDHWCSKGHVVLVMEGSLTTVLEDGRKFVTTAGNSFRWGMRMGGIGLRLRRGLRFLLLIEKRMQRQKQKRNTGVLRFAQNREQLASDDTRLAG